MLACILLMLFAYRLWDKKTGPIYNRWGECARCEARVGAELEKLYKEGFHVFHDWDKGRGNVDHFAIGPQGVFAIETKAWTGEITADTGRLKKDGRFVYENRPITQAMSNAFAVRKLVGESSGTEPFVVPILCFSRAEVRCYKPVSRVEVTSIGTLARVIMDRKARYSATEVTAISEALEETLGVSPAVRPGLPLAETRTKRALDKVFGLSDSATGLLSFGVVFTLSLIFPATASSEASPATAIARGPAGYPSSHESAAGSSSMATTVLPPASLKSRPTSARPMPPPAPVTTYERLMVVLSSRSGP